jgi:hypothetical protein
MSTRLIGVVLKVLADRGCKDREFQAGGFCGNQGQNNPGQQKYTFHYLPPSSRWKLAHYTLSIRGLSFEKLDVFCEQQSRPVGYG